MIWARSAFSETQRNFNMIAPVQGNEHIQMAIEVSGNLLFAIGPVLLFTAFEQNYTLAVTRGRKFKGC
jgi:hypothetical protein